MKMQLNGTERKKMAANNFQKYVFAELYVLVSQISVIGFLKKLYPLVNCF